MFIWAPDYGFKIVNLSFWWLILCSLIQLSNYCFISSSVCHINQTSVWMFCPTDSLLAQCVWGRCWDAYRLHQPAATVDAAGVWSPGTKPNTNRCTCADFIPIVVCGSVKQPHVFKGIKFWRMFFFYIWPGLILLLAWLKVILDWTFALLNYSRELFWLAPKERWCWSLTFRLDKFQTRILCTHFCNLTHVTLWMKTLCTEGFSRNIWETLLTSFATQVVWHCAFKPFFCSIYSLSVMCSSVKLFLCC